MLASRREGDAWSCLEQPDRDGAALAALGASRGWRRAGRTASRGVAAAWRRLAGEAVAGEPDGPPGAGLVAVGGFAFAPEGGAAPHWSGFGAARPDRAGAGARPPRARRAADGRRRSPSPTTCPRSSLARVERRLAELRERRCRCSTRRRPGASGSPRSRRPSTTRRPSRAPSSGSAPARSRRSCSPARSPCTRPTPHDAAAVFGVLRAGFDSCYVYCAGRGDARVHRRLAGAAGAPRGPARVDRRAGRLDPPLRRPGRRRPPRRAAAALRPRTARSRRSSRAGSRRALRPHSVWVAAPDEPSIVRVANIQHLATPIRAQLAHPRQRGRAGRPAAPDARRGRRAARRRRAADPGARGPRPRLVRRPGRVDGRQRGRRVLRRPALRAAARARGARCSRASASCATPSPRPSWPRPRSSSARCCRCSRAGRRPLSAALAPDLEHLAHRRRAVRDARVERADDELEAADSSCSSSVTSAWKRRPFLSSSTMSPAPDALRGLARDGRSRPPSSPGRSDQPLLRHGSRNPRRRPGRPPTPRGAARRSPRRSVRTWISVARGAASARVERLAEALRRRRRARRRARTARRRARSRARAASRRAPRSASPCAATGRKSKIPPPSLSSSTITSGRPQPPRREQAAEVVQERDVADQQHGRPAGRGRDAERGRGRAVDPVRAAVGEHPRRRGAGGEERLDVADRHRGGDHQRALLGQPHAELGRDARLAQPGRPQHLGDRARGGPVGPGPLLQPVASRAGFRGSRVVRARRASPAGRRAQRRDRAGRVLPRVLGVEGDLQRRLAEPVQPLAQRLGRRQVADAQHEVGARAAQAGSRSSAS